MGSNIFTSSSSIHSSGDNDDEDGVEDLKLRVCDARQACGGDCDNDFPKDFREDVEWNAFAFSWTLLESIAWHRVRQKINEEWIANAGDCPAVLCRKGKALDISFDHKYTFEQEERQVGYLGWYFEASIFTVNLLYKFSWRPVNKKVLTHQRVFVASNLRPGCSADEFFIMGCGGVGRCWGLHGMICCYIGHARVQESR
ncbi:hypothetical protein Bca52824_023943 [Brassica carinata]|uniref:PPM-type phosphatase domain-containing protein n=1 Tax=Brassica carinata TaxID=52824 RepID=A0A8X7VJF4_BRACI|nr:hypothetical protein Bca52824_023943 [Brassica carinata]